MTEIERMPGQSPMVPGAIRAGGFVFTSGTVADVSGSALPIEEQASGALNALLDSLTQFGCTPADVVRLEAFLADADDFAAWNQAFLMVWPQPGPTRTTLVCSFALPGILIEVQAIAVVPDRNRC
ncbi:RidA family protein [Streptomyces sp. NPDC004629]|uniref:RidA family protein n=1 Tax=Streptomyces sp. NPDC004629 TaxID=3364705 RepID=UPI0036D1B673